MIKEIRGQVKKGRESSFACILIPEEGIIQEECEQSIADGCSPENEPTADSGWKTDEEIKYLVDHTSEAFWQMDKDFKFTFTNAACEKVSHGFKNEDFVGRSLLEFLTPDGIKYLRQSNGGRQKNEAQGIKTDVMFYELQMKRKDGTYFWAGISSSPRRDKYGKLIGYQGIMRDISSFKRYEDDCKRLEGLLTKAEKMAVVGNMAGGVAHELNNVMVGILGYSELLMFQDDLNNDDFRKHIRNIIDSGERAVAIVQDLVMISHREGASRKSVNLNELIPDCLSKNEFHKLLERYPGIKVNLDLEPSLHGINASFRQLEKSIMNLLSVSIQQAGAEGTVLIATKTVYLGRPNNGYDNLCEGEYVVLSIAASGAGISDDDISHIFEPFYVKKVMKKGITGLELSIVREVIKDHNGFIDVLSKMGCGATFTVYLPVSHTGVSAIRQLMSQADYPDGAISIN